MRLTLLQLSELISFRLRTCCLLFTLFIMSAFLSLHAEIRPANEVLSHTYQFYVGDVSASAKPYYEQILLNGEQVLAPIIPQSNTGFFIGWYELGASGSANPITLNKPISVKANKTVKLQARFSSKVYVQFILEPYRKENEQTKGALKVLTIKELNVGGRVNSKNIPYVSPAGTKFKHWASSPNGEQPFNFERTPITSNMSLYAVVTPAVKVSFKMRGGKAILPKFYDKGEPFNLKDEVPFRAGYHFAGWTLQEPKNEKDEKNLPRVANGGQINRDVVLYAIWEKRKDTPYKVVHWTENANDDTYSVTSVVFLEGETESVVQYNKGTFDGFHLNTTKTNAENPQISGLGTTVKHVYHSRNRFTLTFVDKEGVVANTGKEIKYEQKTDYWWDQIVSENPQYVWLPSEEAEAAYSKAPKMPNHDLTVYAYETKGYMHVIHYLDLHTGVRVEKDFVFGFADKVELSEHDTQVDIEGFSYQPVQVGDNKFGRDFEVNESKTAYAAVVYFTRNKYSIVFFKNDGSAAIELKDIPFEDDISQKSLSGYEVDKTTRKDGYIFGGWFTTSECIEGTEFHFTEGKKMPAAHILLYAKWYPPKRKIKFHVNTDFDSAIFAIYEVAHNSLISEKEIAAFNNLSFPGKVNFDAWFWYKDGFFLAYDYMEQITADVDLYPTALVSAYKIVYHAGGASGALPQDLNVYAVGKAAVVKDGASLQHPEGKIFLGWKSDIQGDATLYLPWMKVPVVNATVNLTAQWGDVPEKTVITYRANRDLEDTEEIREADKVNNAKSITKPKDTFKLEYFELKSWNTKADGTGESFDPNSEIIVNNRSAVNVLYAQWELAIDGRRTTGVDNLQSASKLIYYPNPIVDRLYIESEKAINSVQFFDLQGKVVLDIPAVTPAEKLELDLSNLKAGFYLMRLSKKDGVEVIKVLKK